MKLVALNSKACRQDLYLETYFWLDKARNKFYAEKLLIGKEMLIRDQELVVACFVTVHAAQGQY